MKYIFSAELDGTRCHIRSFQKGARRQETVKDRPHKHYFVEFHCVFAGEEIVTLPQEKREVHLRPGQILLLPQECYHGVYTGEGTVDRLCFNFSCEADTETPLLSLYKSAREIQVFEDPEAIDLALRCRQMRMQPPGPLHDQKQGLLLLSLVVQLLSRLSADPAVSESRDDRALRQKWIIEEYIEQHFTEDMGLAGLADALYLTQRQTRKLVRQFMGEDYKTIIIRRRMELAEIYLRDGTKTLEEIAWLVGYRSYSGFQLCFKKYFGITPSEKR